MLRIAYLASPNWFCAPELALLQGNAGRPSGVNRSWPTKGITMLTESMIVNTPVSVDPVER